MDWERLESIILEKFKDKPHSYLISICGLDMPKDEKKFPKHNTAVTISIGKIRQFSKKRGVDLIKERIKELNLTQYGVAYQIGASQATMNRILHGKTKPTERQLMGLLYVLDIDKSKVTIECKYGE